MSYDWSRVFGGTRGGLIRWKHKTTCGLNATGHATCTCGGPAFVARPFDSGLIRDVRRRAEVESNELAAEVRRLRALLPEGADPGVR